jgi:aerobic carbon-monoxide dehydrogenase medium subunit
VKPPPFEYHAPRSVEAAVRLLAELEDAKVLAGGQSLLPLLNFRLARPAHLVDINGIAELNYVRPRDGGLALGACVRQADVPERQHPLLHRALRLVAHPVIRNRGTVVGSIVHADPAAELPALLLALGGTVTAVSARGRREISGEALFQGPLQTSLAADELAVEAWFPLAEGAIAEESRRHGDFALAGAIRAGERLALFGVAPTPVLADPLQPRRGLRPAADLEASSEFRLHLVDVLVERVMAA